LRGLGAAESTRRSGKMVPFQYLKRGISAECRHFNAY
jgi:hypothetical protein